MSPLSSSLPSLPATLSKPVSHGAEMLRGALGGWTWGPALAVAKPAILSLLARIDTGTLLLVDEPGDKRHVFGQRLSGELGNVPAVTGLPRRATTVPGVEVVVKNEAFWMRLFLFADMGFAEAYMLGDFQCQDLTSFFQLFIVNRDRMNNGTTWISSFSSTISSLARSTNTLSNSLLNISAHYDISNDMFAAFLSPDMTYSCPVWRTRPHSETLEESLEDAQVRKLLRFIDGARIKATDHVLEIGTGWGSLAIEAVRRTGCRVTSLTLSAEQKSLAEERVQAAGLGDRIEIKLMDYRNLPVPSTPYDKIVSIEMLEAVGEEYLATYFACVNRLLKKRGGIAMFQCITMPEGRHEAYSRSEDFINHYIFPGGYLPSTTQLLSHISQQSQGTLIVENVENIGGHYARTLRLWNEKFQENFNREIKPALLKEHPDMTKDAVEVFRRKWEYYFTYCEAGFLTKTLGDIIITVGREGALELMEGIPL
ncbi:mycolic acid cyclopropane synthetase domain-containing protein [Hirsutella rhossiliensis]|uniref:Mycolic acid cyclopropane synthetase domain-containing protein n=1 Tax=Hirsutella rhossiliensis TaxID=111463 RepID=A0A9P8SFQ7_9HYPO|nr:mycolic acid cyclopropane synthetase domain-containing protein [Hirsutella rhossiliensis]KAH0960304.1 mycolic acid cyclopropane synthetase domain-containing protein [Hirsutella rhossiliensis]